MFNDNAKRSSGTCLGCGDHTDMTCTCDCGKCIHVCPSCLAEDKVLACGGCGIEEALSEDDDNSIHWARQAVKMKLQFADILSAKRALQYRIDELEGGQE